MIYRGTQWEVTSTVLRRINDGWDLRRDLLDTENNYGIGPIYECFGHVADTKDNLDLDDFTQAFKAAWPTAKLGPLDHDKLARSVEQARAILK